MNFEGKEKLMREKLDPYSLILVRDLSKLELKLSNVSESNDKRKQLADIVEIQKGKIKHINNLKTYLDKILDLTEFIKDESLSPEQMKAFSQKREELRATFTKEVNLELNTWLIRNTPPYRKSPSFFPKHVKIGIAIIIGFSLIFMILFFLTE